MHQSFTYKGTQERLAALNDTRWDVVVIGGGITGAGILLDAQSRGLKAVLVEMQDFGAGTSSRSTKLIHGGLRYLKQMEFRMVAEVGKERAIVHRNAPHLTRPVRLVLPIVKGGSIGRLAGKLALTLYDWLAGVSAEDRHRTLSAAETSRRVPGLNREILKGGIEYVEYTTDDARLTLEIIKAAVSSGATALNYVRASGFLYEGDRVAGIKATCTVTGKTAILRARSVVNASGPWTDAVCELDNETVDKKLLLTKGVHIVVDKQRFPLETAIYFDTADKRMVFAIPRFDKVYIGTTDTVYEGDTVSPQVDPEDKNYLIAAVNTMFPSLRLTTADIESGWAGLRPLIMKKKGASPSEISRKDEVFVSQSGLITITGGKLTGYRKMAEKVVNRITNKPCITDTITLPGGDFQGRSYDAVLHDLKIYGKEKGVGEQDVVWLFERYGTKTGQVLDHLAAHPVLPGYLYAALQYSLQEEWVATPVDFFERRTSMTYFAISSVLQYKEAVVEEMAVYFGWTAGEKQQQAEVLDGVLYV